MTSTSPCGHGCFRPDGAASMRGLHDCSSVRLDNDSSARLGECSSVALNWSSWWQFGFVSQHLIAGCVPTIETLESRSFFFNGHLRFGHFWIKIRNCGSCFFQLCFGLL